MSLTWPLKGMLQTTVNPYFTQARSLPSLARINIQKRKVHLQPCNTRRIHLSMMRSVTGSSEIHLVSINLVLGLEISCVEALPGLNLLCKNLNKAIGRMCFCQRINYVAYMNVALCARTLKHVSISTVDT